MDASGKEWEVTWNASEGCWGNSGEGVLFVQDGNEWSGGESNVWVANHADPTMRERVVWKNIRIEGEPEARPRWVRADNDAIVWNGSGWDPVTLQQ
jgi:hypothetical protein